MSAVCDDCNVTFDHVAPVASYEVVNEDLATLPQAKLLAARRYRAQRQSSPVIRENVTVQVLNSRLSKPWQFSV